MQLAVTVPTPRWDRTESAAPNQIRGFREGSRLVEKSLRRKPRLPQAKLLQELAGAFEAPHDGPCRARMARTLREHGSL